VLYGAFLAGIGVAGRVTLPVILLLGVVNCLAFANGPLALMLRSAGGRESSPERGRTFFWFFAYGVGALLCAAPLLAFYQMTFLIPFAMVAACFLVLRAFLSGRATTGVFRGNLSARAAWCWSDRPPMPLP